MVVFITRKLIEKALKKLLKQGEELTAVAMVPGVFKQQLIGTTTNDRLIIAQCAWLSNKPNKPFVDVPFTSIKKIDIACSTLSIILQIETHGEQHLFKFNVLFYLFDIVREIYKMYHLITTKNPHALPSYHEGEHLKALIKVDEGVLKLAENTLFLSEFNKKNKTISLKHKVKIDDISKIELYPGKGYGSKKFLVIKTNTFSNSYQIGAGFSFLVNFIDRNEVLPGLIGTEADVLFYELLKKKPSAKPSYFKEGEMPMLTFFVSFTQVGLLTMSKIFRLTNKRILILDKRNEDVEMDFDIPLEQITQMRLIRKKSRTGAESYKFEIVTPHQQHIFYALPTLAYGYEAFLHVEKYIEKVSKLNMNE